MTYIIILNWNGWADTIECLESVIQLRGAQYRIVVCDNHSSDDSIARITQWIEQLPDAILYLPHSYDSKVNTSPSKFQLVDCSLSKNVQPDTYHRISLIQTGENSGYGAGNNVGIRFALEDSATEHVWVLNNDVVVSADALMHLHAYQRQHSHIGLIGSKLMFYHQPDCIQAIGGQYNKFFATTRHLGEFERDLGQYDHSDIVNQIDYPVGASLFVSKAYIESVGLLSEEYFLYFEEIDWVRRGAQLGWQPGYCWQSVVFHKEGGATGSAADPKLKSKLADDYSLMNRMRFTRKFHKYWVWTVRLGLLWAGINRLRRGQFDRLNTVLKAICS